MRYPFIFEQRQEGRYGVWVLCRVMKVSPSGYFAWRRRALGRKGRRHQENERLLLAIRATWKKSHKTYGSPRVFAELRAQGDKCGRHRVARLMRKHGLSAQVRRRFVVTTDSKHDLPVAANLVDQQFATDDPNARWTADITYLWTKEGWLYLAGVLDLCSRRLVGWSMQDSLDRSLVIDALDAALGLRRPGAGLVCHSDRGSQYASDDYQKRLRAAGAVCSMSRKGNCYDNAPMESFFASLKRELVHRCVFATKEEARRAVFWWIEVWYNRQRRHSALGYLSPEQFEQQQSARRAA